MINYKQIKSYSSKSDEHNKKIPPLLKKVEEYLHDKIASIHLFFRIKYRKFMQAYQYAKYGWNDFDWDYVTIFDIMAFKMNRIEKCLKKGHHVQIKAEMDALKECQKICKRLRDEDFYEDKYYKLHNKKWGKANYKFIKNDNNISTMQCSRKNIKTKEDKKLEVKDFLQMYKNSDKDWKKDVDRLCHLFKKYSRTWWS